MAAAARAVGPALGGCGLGPDRTDLGLGVAAAKGLTLAVALGAPVRTRCAAVPAVPPAAPACPGPQQVSPRGRGTPVAAGGVASRCSQLKPLNDVLSSGAHRRPEPGTQTAVTRSCREPPRVRVRGLA